MSPLKNQLTLRSLPCLAACCWDAAEQNRPKQLMRPQMRLRPPLWSPLQRLPPCASQTRHAAPQPCSAHSACSGQQLAVLKQSNKHACMLMAASWTCKCHICQLHRSIKRAQSVFFATLTPQERALPKHARSRVHFSAYCNSACSQKTPCLQIPHTVLQMLVFQEQQVHPLFKVATLCPLQRKAQVSAHERMQSTP